MKPKCTAYGDPCERPPTRFFLRTGAIRPWDLRWDLMSRCDPHSVHVVPDLYERISCEEYLILQVLEG